MGIDKNHVHVKTWKRRSLECKAKHRPKLKNWERDGFASVRLHEFQQLPQYINETGNHFQIERIHTSELSIDQFITHYEMKYKPCIIVDIPKVEKWKALESWNYHNFHDLKERYFKVGEDDDGKSVKMKLKYFLKYALHNQDDSPLYIFDSRFDDDPISKRLLEDYQVPKYFPDDLFRLVGEKRRPPYRWVLFGPARSGSCVHIDPLGTSAWNTVIVGRKLWALFPPGTPKRTVKALDYIQKGEDDEAINYFVDHLQRLKAAEPDCGLTLFIQYPGETVYVPGGWWHAVLNLDDTIAVTQNYASRANFKAVWMKTRTGRRKMAQKWLRRLEDEYPELASQAKQLNHEDEFSFSDEERKHKMKKARKDAKKKS